MTDLRAIYRQALPGRIEALEAARSATSSADADATVRRIAHALRGSGGTYGFPEVSAAAAAVEDAAPAELPAHLDSLINLLRSVAGADDRVTRILVVDDEPEQALLIRAALERPGRTVLVARTRAEARTAIAEGGISLVLLDLLLPDSDGRSVLLELREKPETAEIPVIIVSGKSDAQAKSECFSLGANGYLEKPLDPDLLAAVVGSQLRAAPVPPAPVAESSGQKCIMIVEDDDLVASVLRHRLEREGFCIRHYTDGITALDAVGTDETCLAILDVKIPGIDGFVLLERLRASSPMATVPIIMLTSMGAERDVLRAFQLGANDYITKPFSPVEVLARVKRLLKV